MTRIRQWLRQHTEWLRIGLWVTGALLGLSGIVVGVGMIHAPSALIVGGLFLVGLAVVGPE